MIRYGKSLMVAGVSVAFLASASAQSTAAPGSGAAEKIGVYAAVPVPASPEHLPPASPQVSFLNGQLTIISHNSTLADILAAVQHRTGAIIEMPAGTGAERVAGLFGPGPAADVLAALLNGSQFDYLMLSAPSDPTSLARLVLKTRVASADLSRVGTPQMRTQLGGPSSTAEQMPTGVAEQMPTAVEEQVPMGAEEQMPSADQLSPRIPPAGPNGRVARPVPPKVTNPSPLRPPNSTSRAD